MNVKEHIEAGHYPKDAKGRALVPMRTCGVATILCTDAPSKHPIVGQRPCTEAPSGWTPDGKWHWQQASDDGKDLLPPVRRKVCVKAWAAVNRLGEVRSLHFRDANPYANGCDHSAVELTGEFEVPWT